MGRVEVHSNANCYCFRSIPLFFGLSLCLSHAIPLSFLTYFYTFMLSICILINSCIIVLYFSYVLTNIYNFFPALFCFVSFSTYLSTNVTKTYAAPVCKMLNICVCLSVYLSIFLSVYLSVCSFPEISKSNLHPSYPVSCRRSESQIKF